jgi:hypothetical protein
MNNGKIKMLFIVQFAILCLIASCAIASDDELSRTTLKGLKGMMVSVNALSSNYDGNALISKELQTELELKLRLARIEIITDTTVFKKSLGLPFLQFDFWIGETTDADLYNYKINLSLNQGVTLVRNPQIRTISETWSQGYVGGMHELDQIREKARELMDMFVNAYLSANPINKK